jgi:hypothetical protein
MFIFGLLKQSVCGYKTGFKHMGVYNCTCMYMCVCVCVCMLLCPFVIVLTLLQEEFRPVKPIRPSVLTVAELIFETNNLFLFLETSKEETEY